MATLLLKLFREFLYQLIYHFPNHHSQFTSDIRNSQIKSHKMPQILHNQYDQISNNINKNKNHNLADQGPAKKLLLFMNKICKTAITAKITEYT